MNCSAEHSSNFGLNFFSFTREEAEDKRLIDSASDCSTPKVRVLGFTLSGQVFNIILFYENLFL